MPDISKCNTQECPKRFQCHRFICEPGHWQSYSSFYERGEDCEWFWQAKDWEIQEYNNRQDNEQHKTAN